MSKGCKSITETELFYSHLTRFLMSEYGLSPFDSRFGKYITAWKDLNKEMAGITGWGLAVTDDSVGLPLWGFGLDDGDPFVTLSVSDNGASIYECYLGDDGALQYECGHPADVTPLLYAFKLFT